MSFGERNLLRSSLRRYFVNTTVPP